MLFGHSFKQACDRLPERFVRIVRHVRMRGVKSGHERFDCILRRKIRKLRLRARGIRPEMNDSFAHCHALPGLRRPVNFLFTPFRFRSASHVFRCLSDQLLGEAHHTTVVRVRLIELQHGEFGIVPR